MWEKEPQKRNVIVAVACLAGILGLVLFKHPIPMIFGIGAVILSTAEYWFPVKFRLDETIARRQCGISVSELPWSNVSFVEEGREGVKLLPIDPTSRMAEFRGLYLYFAGNREAVIEVIRNNVDEKCSITGLTN